MITEHYTVIPKINIDSHNSNYKIVFEYISKRFEIPESFEDQLKINVSLNKNVENFKI